MTVNELLDAWRAEMRAELVAGMPAARALVLLARLAVLDGVGVALAGPGRASQADPAAPPVVGDQDAVTLALAAAHDAAAQAMVTLAELAAHVADTSKAVIPAASSVDKEG